jgi:hypothetical protein
LFGLRRLLPPSPQLLTFPAKDGVERALLREADSDVFIATVLGRKEKFAKDYILAF